MMRMGTSIPVSEEVADELHGLKARGESYDDRLRKLLGMEDDHDTVDT